MGHFQNWSEEFDLIQLFRTTWIMSYIAVQSLVAVVNALILAALRYELAVHQDIFLAFLPFTDKDLDVYQFNTWHGRDF